MPKRVRPYGSAEDTLARARPDRRGDLASELAGTMTAPDVAGQAAGSVRELSELTADGLDLVRVEDVQQVLASLERMGRDLPRLCEQIARILVIQREDGGAGPAALDQQVGEAVEALAAAGQAADMMTAALTQARGAAARL